jgi:hypothetical protein
MHRIKFSSMDPIDHSCRALDVVRRMGFKLASLHVEPAVGLGFTIAIAVQSRDATAAETLRARIASCVGTDGVRQERDGGAGLGHTHTGRDRLGEFDYA